MAPVKGCNCLACLPALEWVEKQEIQGQFSRYPLVLIGWTRKSSADTLPCNARVWQAFARVGSGPSRPWMCFWRASSKQKLSKWFHVNHAQTMCKPKCLVCMPRGAYKLWHAQRVWDRLCQVWLHHVFTSPLEVLGPAWQVSTSSFSGTWFCKNRAWDLSCHGRGIGQDHPGKLKRGPMALLRALYKIHPRELKSMLIFRLLGRQRWTRDEFSNCNHVAGNYSNAPQTTTIYRLRSVIKCVLWFISNGALVAEIWPFQVLGYWEVPKLSLLMVYC